MKKILDILILEDNKDDLDLIKHELMKLDQKYETRSVDNRSSYLKLLEEKLPDIILSDYNLPDIDGEEALNILRERDQNIPFILTSSLIGEEKAIKMMRDGANDFIMKDKLGRLIPAIQREIRDYYDKIQAIEDQDELLLFNQIFINSTSAISILDEKGFIISHNLADEKLFGYTIKELKGKTPAIFFGEKDFEINLRLSKQKGFVKRHKQFTNKSGELKTIDLSIIKIEDQSGRIRFACINHDITELEKKKEEISNTKDFYESILENISSGVLVTDRNDQVLYVNKEMERIAGVPASRIIGQSIHEGFDGETSVEFKKKYLTVRNSLFLSQYEASNGALSSNRDNIQRGWLIPLVENNTFNGMICTAEDVTEKVNIQKKLNVQKRQLDTLVSNLPGMAYRCLVDDNWTMLYISDGVKKLTGYEPDELVNNKKLSYNDIIDPDEAEKNWSSIYKAMDEGKHYEIEYKIITKDGIKKWVWEKAFPVGKDENGYIITEGFITDITDRKMIEKMLETSYNIITRSPSVAFRWKNDKDWTVDFVTDNVENIFGYTKEEFYNKKIFYADVIFKEDLGNIIKEMAEYSSKKEVNSFTHKSYRIVTKNDEIKWVKDDTYILRDNDRNIIAYEGIITDVTNIVETQKDLLILSTAVDQSPSIIVLTNIFGDIVYSNPAFTNITGYAFKEVEGKNLRVLKSENMDDELYNELWDTISSGKVWSGEITNKKRDETIYWEKAIISPIFNKQKEIINYLKIGEDITEQKRMESELNKHRDHLEELVKSRTAELNAKFDEVEKLNKLFLNREHRINELRDELKKIKKRFKLD
ncbi:MAG: PAS domain S-box protein [Candidatus Delongbacteria bacterium]|nr:PAS domain S-box protein [Candidatus Delongbacteria bacterium]